MRQIPIYRAILEDKEDGITAMSLVDEPATETAALLFKKEVDEAVRFSIENEDKRLATGVFMLADTPIYRRRGDFEYYVMYDKETLAKMAQKYLKTGNFTNVDLNHDGNMIEGVELQEIYQKDVAKGINPTGFEQVADGSLFGTFKVENDDVWEALKDGTFQGFSLEGYFSYEETNLVVEKYNKNKKKISMSKVKNALKKLLAEFASVETDKGVITIDGDVVVGAEVEGENGEALEDGEYATEEKIIVIAEGKITEIRDKEAESGETESEAQIAFKAEKAKFEATYGEIQASIQEEINRIGIDGYVWDAGEGFAIVCVYEDGGYNYYHYEVTANEDGSVTLGERYEVEQKWVAKEVESGATEETESGSTEETESGSTEEFAEETESGATEETESGSTEETESGATEETESGETSDIEAMKTEIEDLKAEIEALKEAVNTLSNEPAKENVAEEFEAVKGASVKTGNKKMDNLMRLMNA